MVMWRAALFLLLATLALPAAAQDEGPPVVTPDAPAQLAAPVTDPAAVVPSLPAGSDHLAADRPRETVADLPPALPA